MEISLDLLHNIHEGQTGMLVFSSRAFVVSPLTSDSNTIAAMVPVIDSSIVPVQGSDINPALKKAASLLRQAGYSRGEIILVTDSVPDPNTFATAQKLNSDGYTISILGIGSKQGGPVTNADGSFVTDNNGNIILATLDSAALAKLAAAGGGYYIPFTNNNSDIQQLLNSTSANDLKQNPSQEAESKSLWKDQGHWLIWCGIILAAFLARKGWLEKLC